MLPSLMFGAGHPVRQPAQRHRHREAAIAALTRADLVAFHQRMMQPKGATVIVVGDTTLKGNRAGAGHRGDWKVDGAGAPAIRRWPTSSSRVFLIDQCRGAVQATSSRAELVPSAGPLRDR